MTYQKIQVLGGETFATAESNFVFTAVLGPCVAACIFDPHLKIGGMNHFLLSKGGGNHATGQDRFGDVAMNTLLNDLISLGGNPWGMQARLFGGRSTYLYGRDVGAENALFAKRFLLGKGVRLVASDLGGDVVRWVTFNPTTGHATLKGQGVVPTAANNPARACGQWGR